MHFRRKAKLTRDLHSNFVYMRPSGMKIFFLIIFRQLLDNVWLRDSPNEYYEKNW